MHLNAARETLPAAEALGDAPNSEVAHVHPCRALQARPDCFDKIHKIVEVFETETFPAEEVQVFWKALV